MGQRLDAGATCSVTFLINVSDLFYKVSSEKGQWASETSQIPKESILPRPPLGYVQNIPPYDNP